MPDIPINATGIPASSPASTPTAPTAPAAAVNSAASKPAPGSDAPPVAIEPSIRQARQPALEPPQPTTPQDLNDSTNSLTDVNDGGGFDIEDIEILLLQTDDTEYEIGQQARNEALTAQLNDLSQQATDQRKAGTDAMWGAIVGGALNIAGGLLTGAGTLGGGVGLGDDVATEPSFDDDELPGMDDDNAIQMDDVDSNIDEDDDDFDDEPKIKVKQDDEDDDNAELIKEARASKAEQNKQHDESVQMHNQRIKMTAWGSLGEATKGFGSVGQAIAGKFESDANVDVTGDQKDAARDQANYNQMNDWMNKVEAARQNTLSLLQQMNEDTHQTNITLDKMV